MLELLFGLRVAVVIRNDVVMLANDQHENLRPNRLQLSLPVCFPGRPVRWTVQTGRYEQRDIAMNPLGAYHQPESRVCVENPGVNGNHPAQENPQEEKVV